MFIFLRSYLRLQGGASAIEFALLAPVLVFMLVATLDFGMFIKQKMMLQSMVSTAADYAMRTQSDGGLETVAENAYGGEFENITLIYAFECECSDGVVRQCPTDCAMNDYQRRFIKVDASGVFEPMFPYPGVPSSLTLDSTSRMRID
jgi:Flp pilus assembly pilin Flp